MNISCPNCGFSATIDPARIPVGGTTAGCPKCACRFAVTPLPPAAAETCEAEASGPLLVLCPACRQEQPLAASCCRCGVIFARYRTPRERRPQSPPPAAAPLRFPLPRRALLPVVALLGLLVLWIVAKDRIPTAIFRAHETLGASASLAHGVAVRSDGTVWTWGDNRYGQLGSGRRDAGHAEPAQVSGLDGAIAVAAGMRHTLALKRDGSVWSWGSNESYQLGDVSGSVGRSLPVRIDGLDGVTAIAAGDYFSVALKSDGTLWYFGDNILGGSGGGIWHDLARPRRIEGIADVAAVACGRRFIVALRKNGSVWCWGVNDAGQCGVGDRYFLLEPQEIAGLDGVAAIAAGESFALALKRDGTVWAWGTLHIPAGKSLTRQSRPAPLPELTGVKEVRAGYWMAVALRDNGTVWSSGDGGPAVPGERHGVASLLLPKRTAGIGAIFAGGRDAFLEKRGGTLICWGPNDFGKTYARGEKRVLSLAVLAFDPQAAARVAAAAVAADAPPPFDEQFQSIAAGNEHALALGRDGSVWSWGKNDYGQLGRRWGSKEQPGRVTLKGDEPLDKMAAIAAGAEQSLAVSVDGALLIWGRSFASRQYEIAVGPQSRGLGRGRPLESMPPVRVSGIDDACAVAGGFGGKPEYIVLHRSGRVSLFGLNDTATDPLLARPVAGLDDVVAVAAGSGHYAVLKKDGTVWTWGKNDGGQLGDGKTAPHSAPQAVPGLANVVKIAAGSAATLAVTADGSLWGWGKQVFVTLPSGLTSQDSLSPIRYPELTEIADASLPGNGYTNGPHYLAVDRQGSVWSWGGNFMGQLGQGTVGTGIVAQPGQVKELDGVAAVAAGQAFALALRRDGSIRSWGRNFYGTLGSDIKGDSALPVKVVPVAAAASSTR